MAHETEKQARRDANLRAALCQLLETYGERFDASDSLVSLARIARKHAREHGARIDGLRRQLEVETKRRLDAEHALDETRRAAFTRSARGGSALDEYEVVGYRLPFSQTNSRDVRFLQRSVGVWQLSINGESVSLDSLDEVERLAAVLAGK